MKVRLLYRTFFISIAIVFLIFAGLWFLQASSLPKKLTTETAPEESGLAEVEFESGALARKTYTLQLERLNSYHGDPATDAFLEVPLERAISLYLTKERK
jgi:hypothetical protein